jgi:glutathionylspermidine synthase
VELVTPGSRYSRPGPYGEEGYVYQQYAPLPDFDGRYPVLGAWVVDGEPAGLGIREADTLITSNVSRFVPHLIA